MADEEEEEEKLEVGYPGLESMPAGGEMQMTSEQQQPTIDAMTSVRSTSPTETDTNEMYQEYESEETAAVTKDPNRPEWVSKLPQPLQDLYDKWPEAKACNLCCCGYIVLVILILSIPFWVILDMASVEYPTYEKVTMVYDNIVVRTVADELTISGNGNMVIHGTNSMKISFEINDIRYWCLFGNSWGQLVSSAYVELNPKNQEMAPDGAHSRVKADFSFSNMTSSTWSHLLGEYLTNGFTVLLNVSGTADMRASNLFNVQMRTIFDCEVLLNGSTLVDTGAITVEEIELLLEFNEISQGGASRRRLRELRMPMPPTASGPPPPMPPTAGGPPPPLPPTAGTPLPLPPTTEQEGALTLEENLWNQIALRSLNLTLTYPIEYADCKYGSVL